MDIIDIFKENKNQENALYMKKYMNNKFEFLGIKSPKRKELQKDFLKQIDKKSSIDKELVRTLWNQEYREYQYLAIDYLVKKKKQLEKEDILFIKGLINNKSWWDSVDILAAHLLGEICKMYPELVEEYIHSWSKDENIWIRRSAILYQLKYKDKLDTETLRIIINDNIQDDDFFIKKAIGWILREYSKTNKNWVLKFINENQLSNLSMKEAIKYI
ncbi:DNA alkylation repair protein [Paraclostridium ghonii]|uniref:DNA alkylation repair protein n=1 Tax=Paraclostridium ghonii TaxID=29358 RepID=UPI00202CCDB7|nr:DNA alkylation repair protein [Paeniclostridium ghonii]MCM0167584.1 DNA alkylation repair protein [Paeniclostridium ghonii]